jgi:uncharacterized phosphosugar-binding protein
MEPQSILPAYTASVVEMLQRFSHSQAEVLKEAASRIVDAHLHGKRFLVFGTGHSHMVAEEFYSRAGGLAFVTPMLQNELTLTDHPFKSTLIERTLGMASVYFELYHPQAGDVLLIASNSGRNALPVELAKLAKAAGVTVIAFTNLSQSQTIASRHPEGKNLYHYADLVIDNCGAYGDAGFDLGDGIVMGSTSTVIGAFMAQSLSIQIAHELKSRGMEVPVLRSGNLDGSDVINKAIKAKYFRTF